MGSEDSSFLIRGLAIPATGVVGMIGTYLALWFWSSRQAQRLLYLGNALSAGVLLSGGLVHLLNDAAGSFDTKFPWPFCIAGLAVAVIMMVETGGMYFMEKRGGLSAQHAPVKQDPGPLLYDGTLTVVGGNTEKPAKRPSKGGGFSSSSSSEGGASISPPMIESPHLAALDTQAHTIPELKLNVGKSHSANAPRPHDASRPMVDDKRKGSLLTTLIFLFCLSLHAFIAGMALGAEADVGVLVAILSHKGLAAFALGSVLLHSGMGTGLYQVLGMLFSTATPLGIAVGFVLSTLDDDQMWVGVMKSLAAGTFLYVALVELGPRMTHTTRPKMPRRRRSLGCLCPCGCCNQSQDYDDTPLVDRGSSAHQHPLPTVSPADPPTPLLNSPGKQRKRRDSPDDDDYERHFAATHGHGHSHGGANDPNQERIPGMEVAAAWALFLFGYGAMSALALET